ncbi:MAG: HNH endonuclease [Luteimonas sp.]|nr:HNH endonuclease [Luteimonas sp.]
MFDPVRSVESTATNGHAAQPDPLVEPAQLQQVLRDAPAAARPQTALTLLAGLDDGQLAILAANDDGGETLRALDSELAGAPAHLGDIEPQRARVATALQTGDDSRLSDEKQALLLDLGQIALDIVGIFEPTPFADLTNAGISIGRGNWLDAGLSALGVIPYLGDLGKLGKLPKLANVVERVTDIAKLDPGFADQVRPALQKIRDALDSVPVDSLPASAREAVESMRTKLDEFFAGGARLTDGPRLPDGSPLPAGVRLDIRGTSIVDPATADRLTDATRLPQVADGKVNVSHGPEAGETKTVILSSEAGQTVTKKGYTITKDANGFPIFNSKFDTFVPDALLGTGKASDHFRFANGRVGDLLRADPSLARQMGLNDAQVTHLLKQPPSADAPPGLTWHHHQDTGRLQLLNRAEHQAHVPHTGGMSIWGGGYN